MKNLLLLFFILISQVTVAQFIRYDKIYYPAIHEAELALTDSLWDEALQFYGRAFKEVPTPFARDAYNAATAAILAGHTDLAFHYLEQLAGKGVPFHWLIANPVWHPLQSSEQWAFFMNRYAEKWRQYRKQINLPLQKELAWMSAKDQYFRVREGGFQIYADTILAIDEANMARMSEIILHLGFPGETEIGCEDPSTLPDWFPIIYHYFQKAQFGEVKGIYSVYEYLVTTALHGQLDPHFVAAFADIQGKPIFHNTVFYRIPSSPTLRQLRFSKQASEKLDKARMSLGLEPIADYKKKVRFALRDKRFLFPFTDSVISLSGLSATDEQRFTQDTDPVE